MEFFERKNHDCKCEKRLLRTALSTNSNALKALYLEPYHIAKTNKQFTIGEELILPARTDICHEVLGELSTKKIVQVSLWLALLQAERKIPHMSQ